MSEGLGLVFVMVAVLGTVAYVLGQLLEAMGGAVG